MAKGDRVTISRPAWARKKGAKNPHYIISVNGRGMTMAHSLGEAKRKQKAFQRQVHPERRR